MQALSLPHTSSRSIGQSKCHGQVQWMCVCRGWVQNGMTIGGNGSLEPPKSSLIFLPCFTACVILVPNQGSKTYSLQWKHGFLTTRLPAKSQEQFYLVKGIYSFNLSKPCKSPYKKVRLLTLSQGTYESSFPKSMHLVNVNF